MEAAENPPRRVASTFWRPPNAARRSRSSIFSERTRVETQVKNLCSCGRESVEEQDGRSAKPSAEPADDGNAQRPISMPGRTPLPCTAPLSPSRSDFPPGDPLLACIYGQGARTQHTGRPTRESRPLVVGPRPCLDVALGGNSAQASLCSLACGLPLSCSRCCCSRRPTGTHMMHTHTQTNARTRTYASPSRTFPISLFSSACYGSVLPTCRHPEHLWSFKQPYSILSPPLCLHHPGQNTMCVRHAFSPPHTPPPHPSEIIHRRTF